MWVECESCLCGHTAAVWCVSWNQRGDLLASCGADKTIRFWRKTGDKWECAQTLDGVHTRTVRHVTFSPCDNFLASSSFDSSVVVWKKFEDGWETLTTLEGHENEVKCAQWSPSGRFLASCGRDKSVWVWEMDEDDEFQCCSILQHHTQDVKSVWWAPTVDVMASCGYDDSIKFYYFDGEDWLLGQNIANAHKSTVWHGAIHRNGDLMASCSSDGFVKIWHRRNRDVDYHLSHWESVARLKASSNESTQPIYSVDWCHDRKIVAVGTGNNDLCFYEASNNSTAETMIFELIERKGQAHSQDINCVRWNPTDQRFLASCSDEEIVKIWKIHF